MSSRAKLISFIDIPAFSDDVRGFVMDFLYFRDVTKLILMDKEHYLSLGIDLEKGKLCFKITVYNNDFNYTLSSFGTDCESVAIKEYQVFKNYLSSTTFITKLIDTSDGKKVVIDWNQVYLTHHIRVASCIYRRYAFCPVDESTSRIDHEVIQFPSEVRALGIFRIHFYEGIIPVEPGERKAHVWHNEIEHLLNYSDESGKLKKYMIIYQNLVIRYGKQSENGKRLILKNKRSCRRLVPRQITIIHREII